MSTGKQILKARREMNLTQKQLAEKIGQDASAIARWETDVFRPSAKNIEKLAQILGKEYKYFYEESAPSVGEVKDSFNPFDSHAQKAEYPLTGIIKKGEVIFFNNADIPGKDKYTAPEKYSLNIRDNSAEPDFADTDTIEIMAENKITPSTNSKYFIVEIKDTQYLYKCFLNGHSIVLTIGKQRKEFLEHTVKILGIVVAVKKLI